MIEGVEILNSVPVYTYSWGWTGLGICFFIISLVGFIFLLTGLVSAKKDILITIIGLFLFFIGVVLGISICSSQKTCSHNQYQVVVDEKVSMKEFMEKYNILEQDGKIFTIEEKRKN